MGTINYFRGIEFKQNLKNGTLTLSQRKYTKEILTLFGMENSKPILTPMDGNKKEEGMDEELP